VLASALQDSVTGAYVVGQEIANSLRQPLCEFTQRSRARGLTRLFCIRVSPNAENAFVVSRISSAAAGAFNRHGNHALRPPESRFQTKRRREARKFW
jgi:hypothetical protein